MKNKPLFSNKPFNTHELVCGHCGLNTVLYLYGICVDENHKYHHNGEGIWYDEKLLKDLVKGDSQWQSNEIGSLFGICSHCGLPVIFGGKRDNRFMYPRPQKFNAIEHLPEDVGKIYNEMRSCFGANNYSALAMLARTLLKHIATEQGHVFTTKSDFVESVDFLKKEFFPKVNSNFINQVKKYATEVVHDLTILEDKDIANNIMLFSEQILKMVYELPNK